MTPLPVGSFSCSRPALCMAWPALAEPWNSLLMTSQDFQAELASVLNRRFEMSHTKDIDFSALASARVAKLAMRQPGMR